MEPRQSTGAGRASIPSSRRRLIVLTLSVLAVAEMTALLPFLAESRRAWLAQNVAGSAPSAVAASAADAGHADIELSHENFIDGLGDALAAFVATRDRPLIVTATDWQHAVRVPGRALTQALRRQTLWFILASLPLAAAAGILLYAAMRAALLRPLQRLASSIAAAGTDPDRPAPLMFGAIDVGADPDHVAGHALAELQRDVRTAQWREARLAALTAAIGRANHELRGVLSPALLTAERLQLNGDPAIKRAGDVLVRAVERAAEVMRGVVEQAREQPVLPGKRQQRLRPLIEFAAEQARLAYPELSVQNAVPEDYDVEADHDSMVRAIGRLLRNAANAAAGRVRISADVEGTDLAITVSDDGPGLPAAIAAAPFRFAAGIDGLGLATVRELIRAQGGDIGVLETGTDGTTFRVLLPAPRHTATVARRAAAGN